MNALKKVISYIVLYIIMIIIFCLAMISVYAIPNDRIQFHIQESKDNILNFDSNPFFTEYIKGANLDEFTDLLILNTAMNKGKGNEESVIVRAFENSRYENGDAIQSFTETLENRELYNNQEYSRYWHGIQVILRPLLLLFNYEEILYIFMLVIFMLLGISVIYIYKNLNIIYALAFLFSMLTVCVFIVPMSIQFTGIFIVMFLSIILINILYSKQKEKIFPYLFFIIGGCTCFFDLLTAPLITLGIPLIIVLLLQNKKEKSFKKSIITILKLSIIWGIAYVSTFFIKWVIASIVLKQDMITVAINQILFRTNGNTEYPATRLGAVKENIKYFYNNVLLIVILLIIVSWILLLIFYRKKVKDMKNIIIFVIIALYPYVWYMIFAGHSTIHAYFTYRVQVIAVFAILCAMIECIDINNNFRNKKMINSNE